MNLDSLVKASIDLRMTSDQRAHASHRDMVCNATDLLKGISNVQFLCLFANTLEVLFEYPCFSIVVCYMAFQMKSIWFLFQVLTFCCKQIPLFKNLIHLIFVDLIITQVRVFLDFFFCFVIPILIPFYGFSFKFVTVFFPNLPIYERQRL